MSNNTRVSDTRVSTRINRFGEPGKMDHAPYGTECKVTKHKDFDLYIQMSKNEENPNWVFIGTFQNEFPEEELKKEIENVLGHSVS